ncbi:hypothetical protein Pse7367_1021 [Thalassoporum mexicanum PCC 7367]|nr:hypothetical protein Pse7367_1021 [Pseudanabaena sp. PCC 7367]
MPILAVSCLALWRSPIEIKRDTLGDLTLVFCAFEALGAGFLTVNVGGDQLGQDTTPKAMAIDR